MNARDEADMLADPAALDAVASEVREILTGVSAKQMARLAEGVEVASAIFVTGQGRSGLVGQAFAMRLMQLGFRAHVAGEATAPAIGQGDLLVAISGSGSTACTVHIAEAARRHGARVFAVTADPGAELGDLADEALVIPRPARESRQPGMTFFEQATLLVLDAVVLELMARIGADQDALLARHANLE